MHDTVPLASIMVAQEYLKVESSGKRKGKPYRTDCAGAADP